MALQGPSGSGGSLRPSPASPAAPLQAGRPTLIFFVMPERGDEYFEIKRLCDAKQGVASQARNAHQRGNERQSLRSLLWRACLALLHYRASSSTTTLTCGPLLRLYPRRAAPQVLLARNFFAPPLAAARAHRAATTPNRPTEPPPAGLAGGGGIVGVAAAAGADGGGGGGAEPLGFPTRQFLDGVALKISVAAARPSRLPPWLLLFLHLVLTPALPSR